MGIYETIVNADPFVLILVIALVVNVLSTLVYKYTTNQNRIRELKQKNKDFQKEIRELQKKNPEKAMKKQKEAMGMSGELMKLTLKPTLYTMIPLLLLFGWINSALVYEPITPGEEFTITAEFLAGASGTVTLSSVPESLTIQNPTQDVDDLVQWTLSGPEGRYQLTADVDGTPFRKVVRITPDRKYEAPIQEYDGVLQKITVSNEKVKPFGSFTFFGKPFTMIWAYIVLSIVFSIIIRKLMRVA